MLTGSFCQFFMRYGFLKVREFLFLNCPFSPQVSVYPKKELPFFILFTAGLCSFTALLALLTHQYPDSMGVSLCLLLLYCSHISAFSGDCPNHSDVGFCPLALHPGESRQLPAHLVPSPPLKDVVECVIVFVCCYARTSLLQP